MKPTVTWIVILASIALAPTAGRADMVTLSNPGFETGDYTGWVASPADAYTTVEDYASIARFSGWGDYCAFVGYAHAGEVTQTLNGSGNDEVVIAVGYTYTMTVQVGRPTAWTNDYGFHVALKSSSGTVLDYFDFYEEGGDFNTANLVPADGWLEVQVQYTCAPGAAVIGEHLVLSLSHVANPDYPDENEYPGCGVYDAVTLDVIPEPATAMLCLFGMAGLVVRRHRN